MPGRKSRTPSIEVVIAGGGVSALETALGLRALAGDRVRLTLLAPTSDFRYRPMAVFEPFLPRPTASRRLSLAEFAGDVGATLEQDSVASVDPEGRVLRALSGRELAYDALVIAVGARAKSVFPEALAMSAHNLGESLQGVIQDLDDGLVGSIALVVPSPKTWPLPVYEIALLMQERARESDSDTTITIVTSEEAPLVVFGRDASAGVAEMLSTAGIQILAGADVEMPGAGELSLEPGGPYLRFDRIVAFPQLVGPAIAGLPSDVEGFLPITSSAQVLGVDGVYAVGDATDFPVKHGGISAAQADAAAESIAALAGAAVEPSPFSTLVHGMLLHSRAGRYVYLGARIDDRVARDSWFSETPVWSPAAKIAARYLGPYLDKRWDVSPPEDANWHAWSFLRVLEPGVE